ncbi:hypothetical protein [Nocardioides bruguierae]|uniref:hypothetical protein n=1 Tax=Nocardioides bruguierae TaxID=2945102 RepID=UPI00201FFCB7|nr:hypothetical protein [Nocardioides bruguierae]MCL8026959.1 hypothetical protein [Nocardioides bruguierae]
MTEDAESTPPSRPHGPAWDVEVTIDVGTPTYVTLAEQLHGWESKVWWENLGDLLGGRPGWHCEFTSEGLLWSFGPLGSSLFNLSAPENPDDYSSGVYEVFDYEADTTHRLASTADLLTWLEGNEHRHVDHVRRMKGLASAFDWRVLKNLGVELRVTHDGSSYIGTFPSLPFESAMETDFLTLLTHARQAVARAHDAPEAIAADIDLVVRLDPRASAALST